MSAKVKIKLRSVPAPAPRRQASNVVELRSWARDHDYDDVAWQIEFHARMQELARQHRELFPQMEE